MLLANEQIQQYREIVENAPDGATHYSESVSGKSLAQEYFRYEEDMSVLACWHTWCKYNGWCDADEEQLMEFNKIRSLDNLRTIIAQHDEIQQLRKQLDIFYDIADNSNGVSGYHLNGDIASWEELL